MTVSLNGYSVNERPVHNCRTAAPPSRVLVVIADLAVAAWSSFFVVVYARRLRNGDLEESQRQQALLVLALAAVMGVVALIAAWRN